MLIDCDFKNNYISKVSNRVLDIGLSDVILKGQPLGSTINNKEGSYDLILVLDEKDIKKKPLVKAKKYFEENDVDLSGVMIIKSNNNA